MKLFCFFVLLIGVIALAQAREGRCLKAADPGLCFGNLIRYHFDSSSGKCEEFAYGGCMGNDNRFDTKKECEAACH